MDIKNNKNQTMQFSDKKLHLVIIFSVFLIFIGCLRFVPSRDSLYGTKPLNENINTEIVADEEVFYQQEKVQQARLNELMQKRSAEANYGVANDYHFGPEDLLEFQVFDVPELNLSTRVRPNGTIALPLIGVVHVSGKTQSELEADITKRLSEYVLNPQVSIFVQEYAAHKVAVIGQVANPGRYPLKKDSASLLEMISEAGGRTNGSSGIVVLIPGDAEKFSLPKTVDRNGNLNFGIEIYYEDLIGRGGVSPLIIPLLPDDTVVLQEAGTIHVDGEIKVPGSFQPSTRMTVLGAIASAGGLTYSADVHSVEVIRDVGAGKKAFITVDLEEIALRSGDDVRLRDGDVVRVPSHEGRFVTRQVVDVLNRFVDFTVGGTLRVAQ
jgi:polysaccharide export outer membrane protein